MVNSKSKKSENFSDSPAPSVEQPAMVDNVSSSGGVLSKIRENPWILASFILAVLFVGALVFGVNGKSADGALSEEVVTGKVIDYLQAQVPEEVTLSSVESESGLYKLTVLYQGQSIPVYATVDGKNLVTDLVPIGGSPLAGQGSPAVPTGPIEVDIGNSPVKGEADAPVTIVEFSDFQCPFCAAFYTQTYGQIDENYIKTGKVKIVFKQFPLGFHPEAQKAAESTLCVREQKGDSAFWEMHDLLFENQASLSDANYKKWARQIKGINGAKFDSCLSSGKYYDEVQADLAYGQSIGIQGTPGFFINGKMVSGAQPYSVFEKAIESELSA